MFSSKTDQWSTPQDFFNKLNEEFHFTLDPCANEFNHKCNKYYTVEDDGLIQDCQGLFDPVSGDLTETYFSKGSTGGCNSFMIAVSRLISLASRGGIQIDDIIDQLNSCPTCPSYAVRKATKNDTSKGSSCPMAIGYALKDMNRQIRDELGIAEETDNIQISKNDNNPKCPECGNILCFEGGCNSCKACGYSKCE